MRTGRLAIIKLAQLSINDFLEECHKNSKCMFCQYEFTVGDDLLTHCIDNHKEWIHYKLHENLSWSLKHKDILKPFNPFGDREETGEPNSPEYEDQLFHAPRCKECNHNDANYTVVSSPPHPNGIQLKCVYCGNISVKD
jgi:hypothetical protein